MPIYEYLCEKCNKEEEVIKGINDESDELCPVCKEPMTKLISESSFYIKGWAPGKANKSANDLRRYNEKHRANKKKT